MRKLAISAVMTAATSERVIVTEAALDHAARHFMLPRDILLELLERVLKDPTDVFVDIEKPPREFRFFYRLEDGRYIVAIVKKIPDGSYFASMYPTGRTVRPSHAKLRRLRL